MMTHDVTSCNTRNVRVSFGKCKDERVTRHANDTNTRSHRWQQQAGRCGSSDRTYVRPPVPPRGDTRTRAYVDLEPTNFALK